MNWPAAIALVAAVIVCCATAIELAKVRKSEPEHRLALKEVRALAGCSSKVPPELRLQTIGEMVERHLGVPDKESFWRREGG